MASIVSDYGRQEAEWSLLPCIALRPHPWEGKKGREGTGREGRGQGKTQAAE